ncbi:MAG: OmpH family outer membrane protein [Rikenellaceae bacterium]|nr:OmpH family outer membrane protein [Rikenellaceae bacterium]
MKKIVFLTAAILLTAGVFAQKTAFINTETIFRSIPEYTAALTQIDQLAQEEQARVDADFARIAEMYERYQYQRSGLSETARRQVEDNIIKLEDEATQKQAAFFGPEGTLMQRRIELLKPIQDRVFQTIDRIAQEQGYDMITDISNNPSIVYYNRELDITQVIVSAL